jgi:putative PIN family toxin of toxin-antitoxin system
VVKSPPVAVIDTNVVVSGTVSSKRDSSPVLLLDGMRFGRFSFVLSTPLLEEYREILLRPKLRRLHRLSDEVITELLARIVEHADWLEPEPTPLQAPDPNDQHLWNLLAAHTKAVLVTGDKALLAAPLEGMKFYLPRAFLEVLERADQSV